MKTIFKNSIILLVLISNNIFAQRNIEVNYGTSDPNLGIYETSQQGENSYISVGHWDQNFAENSRCFIMVTDKNGIPNTDGSGNPVTYRYSIINPITSSPYPIEEVNSVKILNSNLVVSAGRINGTEDGFHIETFNTNTYTFVDKMVYKLGNNVETIHPTKLFVLDDEIYLTGHLNSNQCSGLPSYRCKKLFLIKFDINLNQIYSKIYTYSSSTTFSDEIFNPKDIFVKEISGLKYVYIVGDLENIASLSIPLLNHNFGFIVRIQDINQIMDKFEVVVNKITIGSTIVYEGTGLGLIKELNSEIYLGGRSEYLLGHDANMLNKMSTSVTLLSNFTWKNSAFTTAGSSREEIKDILLNEDDQYLLVNQYSSPTSSIYSQCLHKFSNNFTNPIRVYDANRIYSNFGVNLFRNGFKTFSFGSSNTNSLNSRFPLYLNFSANNNLSANCQFTDFPIDPVQIDNEFINILQFANSGINLTLTNSIPDIIIDPENYAIMCSDNLEDINLFTKTKSQGDKYINIEDLKTLLVKNQNLNSKLIVYNSIGQLIQNVNNFEALNYLLQNAMTYDIFVVLDTINNKAYKINGNISN
jgi:hypothetical protein